MNITCNNDISHKYFDIEVFIKDPDQRRIIYQAFVDNFELIQTYFIELIVESPADYLIDFLTINPKLEEIPPYYGALI